MDKTAAKNAKAKNVIKGAFKSFLDSFKLSISISRCSHFAEVTLLQNHITLN